MKKLTLIENCCPPLASPINDAEAVALERIFRALADRHRVKILSLLARAKEEAICVCDFVPALGLAQPTVSYHLKQLVEAGLLLREKRGSYAYFRLAPNALGQIRDALGEETPLAHMEARSRARP